MDDKKAANKLEKLFNDPNDLNERINGMLDNIK